MIKLNSKAIVYLFIGVLCISASLFWGLGSYNVKFDNIIWASVLITGIYFILYYFSSHIIFNFTNITDCVRDEIFSLKEDIDHGIKTFNFLYPSKNHLSQLRTNSFQLSKMEYKKLGTDRVKGEIKAKLINKHLFPEIDIIIVESQKNSFISQHAYEKDIRIVVVKGKVSVHVEDVHKTEKQVYTLMSGDSIDNIPHGKLISGQFLEDTIYTLEFKS